MKLAYVDSSVWIVRAEGFPLYQSLVTQRLHDLLNDEWQFCYSGAVLLEVLAKPKQAKQYYLITSYQNFFQRIHRLNTFEDLFQKALLISESNKLKGMDAVHAAFAIEYDCELFITTDPDFQSLNDLSLNFIDLSNTSPKKGTE